MERWIECSAAEQRILEAPWVRGSGTAADLAAAADVGERLASVCLTRLEQKGAVQRIERENGVVYAPHVQRVEVRAAKPVRPAKGGLLCLALPMGGGAKALKARFSLVAKRPAMKCATAAASAVCVILACLVAVTGRSGAEAYRGFGRLAAGQETVLTQAGGSASIHGKTLANYLRTRHWAALPEAGKSDGTLLAYFGVSATGGRDFGTLTIVETTTGSYRADVFRSNAAGTADSLTSYKISAEDAAAARALAQLSDGAAGSGALHAAWSARGEMALTSATAGRGNFSFLFRSVDGGKSYALVEGDLDRWSPRFCTALAFADRNVGAAAFLSAEGTDGSCLLRTGDGGKTWISAVLDGTDITSNGTSTQGEIDAWRKNSGHIDNIWFEDARCGYAEASYTSGRERKTILLVTNDGGLHFVPQTGGNAARALIQNGAEEGEKTA